MTARFEIPASFKRRVAPILSPLLWTLIGAGAIVFSRHTLAFGNDLRVYIRAARNLFTDQRLYDFARDGMLCFKYPPFYAAFFAPLGWVSERAAVWAWVALQAALLIWLFRMLRARVRAGVLISGFLTCWGLFMGHAFYGQLSLTSSVLMLAAVVYFERASSLRRTALLMIALLPKVFHAGALLWMRVPLRAWMLVLALGALSLPALISGEPSLSSGFRHMLEAMQSTPQFATEFRNQGLPGFLARAFLGVTSTHFFNLYAFIACYAGLSFYWWRVWSAYPKSLRILAAVASVVAIHPMAWKHTYLIAFPFLMLAAERAHASGTARSRAFLWTCVACVGFATSTTLGPFVGAALDWVSIKAWATLAAVFHVGRSAETPAQSVETS